MTSLRWLSGIIIAVFVSTVTSAVAAPPERPDEEEAKQFIQTMADNAIGVLKREDMTEAEREQIFRTVLRERFDFTFISNMVLGLHRSKIKDDEQAKAFQSLFSERVLHRYVVLLAGYAGETVEVVSAKPTGRRDVYVKMVITSPNGASQALDWRVRTRDGQLQVVDVVFENISMVITQREEINSIIRSKGVDGMMEALERYNQNASKQEPGGEGQAEQATASGSDQS